ncbi:YhcN/YlaJ family sporulation lipoprotein [Bacillaceae bacterium W0354]
MNYKGLNIMMFIILFLAGCMSQQDSNRSLDDQEPQRLSHTSELESNREHTNQEAAERLAKIATDLPNVNEATAIVFGDYTIVGIDVDEDLDRSRVGSIKYSVAEAIKHDPYGHYAFVVADGDIMARISRMNELIRQGHPDDAILEELANLVSRFMPETPAKDNKPKQNDPKENNDQMQNIQEDQSNNQMNKKKNNDRPL